METKKVAVLVEQKESFTKLRRKTNYGKSDRRMWRWPLFCWL